MDLDGGEGGGVYIALSQTSPPFRSPFAMCLPFPHHVTTVLLPRVQMYITFMGEAPHLCTVV